MRYCNITNEELQKILAEYPADAEVYVSIDCGSDTFSNTLDVDYDEKDNVIYLD
jgi:hypothetical protein